MQKLLNESDVRRRLCRHIKQSNWARSDALISEYFVENASRRADVVAANGHLVAYEIKSDRDDLDRLSGQLEVFSRCFEAVTVVCTPRHLQTVFARVPKNVGVMCVSTDVVTVERTAELCEITEPDVWLSHLPISTIREILSARAISCPRANRTAVLKVAKSHLTLSEVREEVLRYVKTKKRRQRIELARERRAEPKSDPLVEHRAMLREYLQSRGIEVPR
jgi:hypothetical protein